MRKGTVPYYNAQLGRDGFGDMKETCDTKTFRAMLRSFPRSQVTIIIRGWLAFDENLLAEGISLEVKGLSNRGLVWAESPRLLELFPELQPFVEEMKALTSTHRPWADQHIKLSDFLMKAHWIAELLKRPVVFGQHPGGRWGPLEIRSHGPYRPLQKVRRSKVHKQAA